MTNIVTRNVIDLGRDTLGNQKKKTDGQISKDNIGKRNRQKARRIHFPFVLTLEEIHSLLASSLIQVNYFWFYFQVFIRKEQSLKQFFIFIYFEGV